MARHCRGCPRAPAPTPGARVWPVSGGLRRQFWLPAALTWLRSGALVTFDGFLLMFTTLPMLFGEIITEWRWSVTDTVLVIRALIGGWALPWAPWRAPLPRGTISHRWRRSGLHAGAL